MGWSVIGTGHLGGEGAGGPSRKTPPPPLSRSAAALRWIFFIPCAALGYFVAFNTILFMGQGAWISLLRVGASVAPYPPYLYTLFFTVLAAGLATLLGLSLGMLTAPAHRGLVCLALLLGLVLLDGAALYYYQHHRHYRAVLTVLFESAANLSLGVYTLRGVVRVFGWRGRPQVNASAYWHEKPAPRDKR